jgi:hypothetical protein
MKTAQRGGGSLQVHDVTKWNHIMNNNVNYGKFIASKINGRSTLGIRNAH